MLDFGALPPEVNSHRMYTGTGAGPLLAAASGWDALAAQLASFAAGYLAELTELQAQAWTGSASTAMTTATSPYITWLTTTAAQAETTANQARAAVAAYEAAFAATVPPTEVAANRLQLLTLIATNFLGQNTGAIAATEALYAEMWAQDATAMYGYAASATTASTLTPFSTPPTTTNPAGHTSQSAAANQAVANSAGQTQSTLMQLASTLSQQGATLTTTNTASGNAAAATSVTTVATALLTAIVPLIGAFNHLTSNPVTYALTVANMMNFIRADYQAWQQQEGILKKLEKARHKAEAKTKDFLLGGNGTVLVDINNAARIGGLSVPKAWATATPAPDATAQQVAAKTTKFRALPPWATQPAPEAPGPQAMPTLGPIRDSEQPTGNKMFRMRERRFHMPRPAAGG